MAIVLACPAPTSLMNPTGAEPVDSALLAVQVQPLVYLNPAFWSAGSLPDISSRAAPECTRPTASTQVTNNPVISERNGR